MSESNGNSRLDRIERTLEKLSGTVYNHEAAIADHEKIMAGHDRILKQIEETQLLTAKALLRLAEAQKVTEIKMNETTEKLDALIKIVDDVIRKRPEGGV
jgi:hypothetical protein